MKMGDMYAYIDQINGSTPVRFLALVLRIDDIGAGLDVPVLTALVFSPTSDASHGGTPFEASTGLYPYGTNIPNTFEPIEAA